MTFNAISLWQPWASLLVYGVKPWETRSWSVPIRHEPGSHVARALRGRANASHREDSDTYVAHTPRGEGFDERQVTSREIVRRLTPRELPSACKASRTTTRACPIAASPPLTVPATRRSATRWPYRSCAGSGAVSTAWKPP